MNNTSESTLENVSENVLKIKVIWSEPDDVPDNISTSNEFVSVDVLVYSKLKKEHTVGWFNYNTQSWQFLCREAVGKFKWRYFMKETDTF